mgnify:CR=1 FL=1
MSTALLASQKSSATAARCVVATFVCFVVAFCLALCGCGSQQQANSKPAVADGPAWESIDFNHKLKLDYATQFSVESSDEGYSYIEVKDGLNYLVVPEGAGVPTGMPDDIAVLQQPLDNVYLAATSAMDAIRSIDAVDHIKLSGTNESGWYIDEAREAMASGKMVYAGKYSAPDYELISSTGCDLAIESTMIYHNPDVKEQLERLGVPVFVERSSYEAHPLGRMEWVKLYGVLFGKLDAACDFYDNKLAELEPVLKQKPCGKTVAFFSVNAAGAVTVHKPGDYIVKSIELAGGTYALDNIKVDSDSGSFSTMNMQMESFFDAASDADILIYNSSIEGELTSMDQLIEKSPLFEKFKAVKSGDVWCTGKNLFQEGMGLSNLIADLNRVMTDDSASDDQMSYLHKLD